MPQQVCLLPGLSITLQESLYPPHLPSPPLGPTSLLSISKDLPFQHFTQTHRGTWTAVLGTLPFQSQGGGHQGTVILAVLNNAGSEHSRLFFFFLKWACVTMCYPSPKELLGSNENSSSFLRSAKGTSGWGRGLVTLVSATIVSDTTSKTSVLRSHCFSWSQYKPNAWEIPTHNFPLHPV